MLARRASVAAEYQGVEITDEINKDLLSFEYVDNASGDSDSASLSLKDEERVWLNDWFPEKGDSITPIIKTINWREDGDKQRLPCGRFFVDEPSYDGRPSSFTLNAISSPLNGNFASVDKSRSWRNATLKAIASDIADQAGLKLQFIGNNNPRYDVKEQTDTPDSSFLSDLCEEEGLAMKVTDSKIVIFDESDFEKKDAIRTYKEWDDDVLSYSFKTSLTNTKYAGVNVKYYDVNSGKTIKYLYTITDIDDKSKIYQINKKVNSGDEARRLAQRTLRRLNKKETTGSLSVFGNIELLGGVCVDLRGFGVFDGKYYVEKATHSVGGGYSVDIEIRKVLEGY
ncbi:phage late control D family protein [Lentibacillus sp. Marseille-P4043]|uniref:phage late control D family protein n=1 Tax=Lentibacillus sp. Marseille-P4043 TaxID=2040293 RepID=UPI000D0AC8DE|nr:contractile injection system protein, VgrG/Pvc8 family [Lentibacillus sp. Marseille-P4043]